MIRLPAPQPGLVIRYSYLWAREAEAGEESGRKIRPCAVLVAIALHPGKLTAYVAPITHSRPSTPSDGVEVPAAVRQHLGLDAAPSWIVTTEFNAFQWPGPDLAAVDRTDGETNYVLGHLPKRLTEAVILQFRANTASRRMRVTKRTP